MGELILMHVGDGDGLVKVAEVARVDLTAPRRPPRRVDTMIEPYPMGDRKRRFVLFPARKWLHVAEYLPNGQLTARWSKRLDEGAWFTSAGWGRANKRGRLSSEQVATVEALIEGAPTEADEMERLARLIARMREEDREFITPESVAEFGGVCTIRAREALVAVFGEEWLARQEAAERSGN